MGIVIGAWTFSVDMLLYTRKRHHSAIDYQAPATLYYPAMLIDYATA